MNKDLYKFLTTNGFTITNYPSKHNETEPTFIGVVYNSTEELKPLDIVIHKDTTIKGFIALLVRKSELSFRAGYNLAREETKQKINDLING